MPYPRTPSPSYLLVWEHQISNAKVPKHKIKERVPLSLMKQLYRSKCTSQNCMHLLYSHTFFYKFLYPTKCFSQSHTKTNTNLKSTDYVQHSHWQCPMVHTVHIKKKQINDNVFSMFNTTPWCIWITKVKLHTILTETAIWKDGEEWSDSSPTYFNHHHSMDS